MDERQTFATTVNKYAKEVFEKADKKDPASVTTDLSKVRTFFQIWKKGREVVEQLTTLSSWTWPRKLL